MNRFEPLLQVIFHYDPMFAMDHDEFARLTAQHIVWNGGGDEGGAMTWISRGRRTIGFRPVRDVTWAACRTRLHLLWASLQQFMVPWCQQQHGLHIDWLNTTTFFPSWQYVQQMATEDDQQAGCADKLLVFTITYRNSAPAIIIYAVHRFRGCGLIPKLSPVHTSIISCRSRRLMHNTGLVFISPLIGRALNTGNAEQQKEKHTQTKIQIEKA